MLFYAGCSFQLGSMLFEAPPAHQSVSEGLLLYVAAVQKVSIRVNGIY